VPMGPPVLVGGPPAINFMAAATQMIRTKWVSDKLHALLKAKPGSRLSKVLCFLTGHPVDVMTGEVVASLVDFVLPGPMPLVFERNYYSRSTHDGPLGPGWHHPLDASLTDEGWRLTLRLEDGRERWHAPMPVGASHWDPIERYTLARTPWGYTLALPEGRTLSFARVEGREGLALVRVEDRCGNTLRLSYEGGRLAQVIDSAGRRMSLHHRGDGRLSSVALHRADGQQHTLARYDYDPRGRLASAADALGHAYRYEYRGGVMVRETDRNGLSFHFEYDWEHPEGWCVRTWGDGGIHDHRMTYDKNAHVTVVEDTRGGRTQYFGDGRGVVVKRVDPMGAAWTFDYDDHLRPVAEVDPLGARTERAYDARGRIVVERDPDGERTLTYDERGDLTAMRAPDGATWRYAYDDRGELGREESPDGAVTRFARDHRGALVAATDAHGGVARARYEGDALVETVDVDGRATRFARDDFGRAVETTDARGATTRRAYDACGRLVEVVHPDGSAERFAYDPMGNPVLLVDRQGRTTRCRYEGMGRLVEEVDPAGRATRYAYDGEGALLAMVDPNGDRLALTRDLAGRVVAERRTHGATLSRRRDRAGRASGLAWADERPAKLTRDALGRLVARVGADGRASRYAYDLRGRLVRAETDDGVVELTRDALGRVVRERCDGVTVDRRYDALGRRVARETSLGHRCEYDLGADGALRSLRVNDDPRWNRWSGADLSASGLRAPWSMEVTRDGRDLEVARVLPGGVVARWSRGVAGEPAALSVVRGGEPLLERAYQWHAGRTLLQQIDPFEGPVAYARDLSGGLVAETARGHVAHRTLDDAGNAYRAPGRDDRAYGPGGQLREDRGTRLEHDARGRLVREISPDGATVSYAWDDEGQLRAVTRADGSVVTFGYDAFGRRLWKECAGSRTRYVWDGDELAHEVTPNAPLVSWVFEPGTHAPVCKVEGDRRYAVLCDWNATPLLMVDESGRVAWQGRVDLRGQVATTVAEVTCPWRWAGQFHDPETGLHYNRFRYYAPARDRYLTPDPLGVAGNANAYAYAADPTIASDPFGLIIVYHYTSEAGFNAIQRSGPSGTWDFHASQPPGGHPYGFYVTSKFDPSQTSELHRMGIPADKRTHFFAIEVDDAKFNDLFTPLPGGRGTTGVSLYHPTDMNVPRVFQNDWEKKANRESRTVRQAGCGKV
jgi:RHS repeat-associated protein